ncbi:chemotaxis protein CheW [Methanofollis fontis]|uniref:Chemotaxis protein CheW n=1 Tax=Methanofollis fontis TaxID=2052832 RepID=A0A483CR59_9EURY|nr:chemotaxis protein CheW [Methanofollis fontis]TAJ45298.1 chemotaxis protein CheW [Methanofollis fontis]
MATVDVVKFQLGDSLYALDIHLAQEIVEMLPITPVPRAPPHLAGIVNLRGEITRIINLNKTLGLEADNTRENRKIIVLAPEASNGSSVGMIVDDVHSVIQAAETEVDRTLSDESYIKGIIKSIEKNGPEGDESGDLIIWIDIQRVLQELVERNES